MRMCNGTALFIKRRFLILPLIIVITFCYEITLSQSEVFRGEVIRIADGDTITVLGEGDQKIKVRFSGIDTPEMDQPFGAEARDRLVQMIRGQTVTCELSLIHI